MKKDEKKVLIEKIEACTKKSELIKFLNDNELDKDAIKDEDDMDIMKVIVKDLLPKDEDLEDADATETPDDEEEQEDDDVDATPEENAEKQHKTISQIVANAVKNGAFTYTREIVNVNVTEFDNWCRLSLTLNKPVKGYQAVEDPETGEVEYKLGITKVIFISLYGIVAALKQIKNARFAANMVLSNHDIIAPIIINSECKILCQPVKDGEEYVNPFQETPAPTTFDGDRIIDNVYEITLDESGWQSLMMLKMKRLGMMPSFSDMINMMM